ncbi:MAG: hypothetical protein A3F33_02560 [Candidatus Woykebacteria bacterium RIFCSPHIGHO2_12_FULL_43_10]|uniref:Addiction module toxin, HicA family n=1 Tax=Candidatus Woykebacteria bacterium RIFCSPLOWO2_01_FULL_43_14 TaxID=1802605 RepID=A0A1G1WUE2_9BACT|nr:MAG: hypothetical protein A3F33_02560 [Candidatus Woykebacteria bacterium RIFCSPHIGHO2_12_FULL_43_10]OGY31338.1 MAG: hypothetical protein A3A61_02590 [Candidatus Woykebacteria bacterium RIFCSPLOWO2_01_FULL_43_14]
MESLPTDIRPLELIKALERNGFVTKKAKGSHRRLAHPDGRWTQVAVHPKPIPIGTLRKILAQSGLSLAKLQNSL